MFTSGTSGVPKAVPMTFQAITSNAALTASRLKISQEDRILINSPPYYTSPILHILTMLVQGASVVAETGFLFGDTILTCLETNACTGFGGVPVHFTRILAALEQKQFPDTMRFLMNSGEHLPAPLILQLRNRLPEVKIFCAYGLTEVAGRLCILDAEMIDLKVGSVGKPLDGMTVHVLDETGDESPPSEQGEVFTNGTCLMSGYLNSEDLNRGVMTTAGFATGDIGYLDEDGFLFLVGRRDDIIKVGAEKVSVKMIEQSIYGFSAFADFMVAPKWDEHMGAVPCIYYVLKTGEQFVQEELISLLKGRLPKSHFPAHFMEVEEIPRSTSGKIIKLPYQNNNKPTNQKN
jgi:acyl-CoA synthetase (AMP-forming)/AMP-acid ligase II